MADPCVQAEKIGALKQGQDSLGVSLDILRGDIKGLAEKVDTVAKNINSRPSWSVTIVLTLLTGMCSGMAMYIITVLAK